LFNLPVKVVKLVDLLDVIGGSTKFLIIGPIYKRLLIVKALI